jgi:oligoribonuclease NrnB/cAMP/cGMP phosphodiesterase (DHH superfamily)
MHKFPNAHLIAHDYGQKFLYEPDVQDEVYLLDISLRPFVKMINLKRACKRVVWIDHHKTAIETYEGQSVIILDGARTVGTAACELTWEYLFPGRETPEALRLLGKYDVWDFEDDARVLPFQYAMRAEPSEPETSIWLDVIVSHENWIREMIDRGKAIFAYVEMANIELMEDLSFECIIGKGFKALAVNAHRPNSQLFDSKWDPQKYHLMLAFRLCLDHTQVSLYSERNDVDCGYIAKQYGGGGHKGAAGFSVPGGADSLFASMRK